MRQSGAETLVTEEPDVLIGHVRICGGPGGHPLGLPGISPTSSEGSRFLISTIFSRTGPGSFRRFPEDTPRFRSPASPRSSYAFTQR